MGKAFGIVGVFVAGRAAVDGLAKRRDQVVSDDTPGTALRDIFGGDGSEGQSVIKLSQGQYSGVRGDLSSVKYQADFGIELEPERRVLRRHPSGA